MSHSLISVTEKSWYRIVSNVTTGSLRRALDSGAFTIYWTIRDSGDTAPSDTANTRPENLDSGQAQRLFEASNEEYISSSYPVDVYLWGFNSDEDGSDSYNILVGV